MATSKVAISAAAGALSLADAGPVTMAEADLADAGILFLADLTGPVTVGVAGLDDVGYCSRPTLLGRSP